MPSVQFPPSQSDIEENQLTKGIVVLIALVVVGAFAPASAIFFIVNEKKVGVRCSTWNVDCLRKKFVIA